MEIQKIAIEQIKHAKYNPRKDLKPGNNVRSMSQKAMENSKILIDQWKKRR